VSSSHDDGGGMSNATGASDPSVHADVDTSPDDGGGEEKP
jgi:hypothetical protein